MKPIKNFISTPPQNDAEACKQLNDILQPLYQDENRPTSQRMAIRNVLLYLIDRLDQSNQTPTA